MDKTFLDHLKEAFSKTPGLINEKSSYIELPNTNREWLAQMFRIAKFTKGVEVGVERGLYSEVLLANNPELELVGVDPFLAYGGYRDHLLQQSMDKIFNEATERLAPYNHRYKILRDFSVDAAKEFADNSLDFVYIDGNHEFQNVVNDIAEWIKKVKVGGVISGHDYIKRKVTREKQEYNMHVIPAVHGYIDAYNIKPLFALGRKAKVEGELRDSPRSWFFIKPAPSVVVPHNDPLDTVS